MLVLQLLNCTFIYRMQRLRTCHMKYAAIAPNKNAINFDIFLLANAYINSAYNVCQYQCDVFLYVWVFAMYDFFKGWQLFTTLRHNSQAAVWLIVKNLTQHSDHQPTFRSNISSFDLFEFVRCSVCLSAEALNVKAENFCGF